MNKKFKIQKIIFFLFFLICLGGFCYSLFHIILWKTDLDKNSKIKKELEEKVKVNKEDNHYIIDFLSLKKDNLDTIGYIKVNGTNINYIVVQGKDNDYYSNHNFYKEYNRAGWIFLDYRNQLNEMDKNLIIYGHNMKDGSMFETLRNVLDKSWYENKDNYDVLFVTEKDEYHYQVFSTYEIVAEDYYITTNFNSDEEYLKFLNTLQGRSNKDYSVSLNKDDKILTLSSCLGDGKMRVVLHAKLIDQQK
ncbi:MAG: class B sortase [Bacilli bacterium]|nr:class B sortase [Bacilli bacterium]